MNIYFVYCKIASEGLEEMNNLRPKHLKYIANQNNIAYGGVEYSKLQEPVGICYFIKANEKRIVETFIEQDPYLKIFKKVKISLFKQKFPKPDKQ